MDVIDRRSRPSGAVFSQWQASDGWRLRRMDWRPPPGQPIRGSLLFANGRGDFIEKYLEICAYWQAGGWQVTSFDWRGQGLSRDGEADMTSPFDRQVDDLAGLMEAWQAGAPGPHVAVAHSMGAHLLLRLLTKKKTGLAAAGLIAPMIEINSAPLPAVIASRVARLLCRLGWSKSPVWSQSPAEPGVNVRRRDYLTSSAERYEDELYWKAQEPSFDIGAPSWAWLKAAYQSSVWLDRASLARIDIPVLLIGSDADRLVSPSAIRATATMIPKAELFIYADAGHEILRESDHFRLDALARIDRFLDAHAR